MCMMHLLNLECPVPTRDQDSHSCLRLYAEKCLCLGATLKKKIKFWNSRHFPLNLVFVTLNLVFYIYILHSAAEKIQ